jgi:uncharacterized membrane protein
MEKIEPARIPAATISGSYGYGWQQLWKYFLYFFLVALIVGLLESPVSIVRDSEMSDTAVSVFLQLLAAAYMFLVFPIINYGGDLLYLRGIRDEKMDITVLFEGFKKNYLKIILANLLTFAIIGMGFIFLIVPGIIFACRLAFVSFLVMDKELEPLAAIEKSWELTRGHGWKIFGMALLAIPIFIGGLLCFIVGAFIAVIWIGAAFSAMYHAVDMQEQRKLET